MGILLLLFLVFIGIIFYRSLNYTTYSLQVDPSKFPEVKTERDIEALASRLVSEMTLREKIDQMYGERRKSEKDLYRLNSSLEMEK